MLEDRGVAFWLVGGKPPACRANGPEGSLRLEAKRHRAEGREHRVRGQTTYVRVQK